MGLLICGVIGVELGNCGCCWWLELEISVEFEFGGCCSDNWDVDGFIIDCDDMDLVFCWYFFYFVLGFVRLVFIIEMGIVVFFGWLNGGEFKKFIFEFLLLLVFVLMIGSVVMSRKIFGIDIILSILFYYVFFFYFWSVGNKVVRSIWGGGSIE